MRRALILAVCLVALGAQPALAGSPGSGCGTAFTRATLAEIHEFRPQLPAPVFAAVDMNGNGYVCYNELKAKPNPSPKSGNLNLVDDSGPAQ